MNYHPLVEKLCGPKGFATAHDMDRIVRKFLEEAAKDLNFLIPTSDYCRMRVKQILGIQEVEQKMVCRKCSQSVELDGSCSCQNRKAKDSNFWCAHVHLDSNGRYYCNSVLVDGLEKEVWDICPVKGCHAQRPVEKSKREKIRDRLDMVFTLHAWNKSKTLLNDLADEMTKFLEETK